MLALTALGLVACSSVPDVATPGPSTTDATPPLLRLGSAGLATNLELTQDSTTALSRRARSTDDVVLLATATDEQTGRPMLTLASFGRDLLRVATFNLYRPGNHADSVYQNWGATLGSQADVLLLTEVEDRRRAELLASAAGMPYVVMLRETDSDLAIASRGPLRNVIRHTVVPPNTTLTSTLQHPQRRDSAVWVRAPGGRHALGHPGRGRRTADLRRLGARADRGGELDPGAARAAASDRDRRGRPQRAHHDHRGRSAAGEPHRCVYPGAAARGRAVHHRATRTPAPSRASI